MGAIRAVSRDHVCRPHSGGAPGAAAALGCHRWAGRGQDPDGFETSHRNQGVGIREDDDRLHPAISIPATTRTDQPGCGCHRDQDE